MQEALDLPAEEPTAEATAARTAEAIQREEYRRRLAEKLKDPDFRKIEGFPHGTDEAILALSDPPYYTACPNPFLGEWLINRARPGESEDDSYRREPFAADVSEGKNHAIYGAHSYHTKVPHRAIMRYILHYTNPGDIVFDGFCGTGMTGLAAQLCGAREEVEALGYQVKPNGAVLASNAEVVSKVGARRAVLNDLSPIATFIAANYNLPVDTDAFETEANRILKDLDDELGWMYRTTHNDRQFGRINYCVWGEVFHCPVCTNEINFASEALDTRTNKVEERITCRRCNAKSSKSELERHFEERFDRSLNRTRSHITFRPSLISYTFAGKEYRKKPDQYDLDLIEKIRESSSSIEVPIRRFPIEEMGHGSRLSPKGFEYVHDLFLPRAAAALSALWLKAEEVGNKTLRRSLLFTVEQAIWTMSLLNRYRPSGYSQVNQYLSGVYYVPSQVSEVSPWYVLTGKVKRLAGVFRSTPVHNGEVVVNTGSCQSIEIPANAIDYIFTDPPFGSNIPYADLNYLIESWHGVVTNHRTEATVDGHKSRSLLDYQRLMTACFENYHRVLKPGRWMTVEFHNSANSVWNAIQEALEAAGFVVADVRVLSKEQASFRQVTAASAVKQDLVISCYKPDSKFSERFSELRGQPEGAIEFIRQHLDMLPVAPVTTTGQIEALAERGRFVLFDRMVGYHLQRGARIPLSAAEFYRMLEEEFVERDGMYFLPDQAARYDAVRVSTDVEPLSLFVKDERTAVQWVRARLTESPQTLGELTPRLMQELQALDDYETLPELRDLLKENFLLGADERWRVPDANDEKDLEAIRRKNLLRLFDGYVKSKGILKSFRKEAVLEGFRYCWSSSPRQYAVIVAVSERIPASVLAEIHELQQFYDIAREFPAPTEGQLTFTWEG